MKTRNILLTVLILPLLFGCGPKTGIKSHANAKRNKAETLHIIESPQLAKIILKPVREEYDLKRDPFAPLSASSRSSYIGQNKMDTHGVSDMKLLGVAKINEEFIAYLKGNTSKGTYRINDKINDYTIMEINNEKVVLNNGAQIVILKRGVEK